MPGDSIEASDTKIIAKRIAVYLKFERSLVIDFISVLWVVVEKSLINRAHALLVSLCAKTCYVFIILFCVG